MDLELRQPLENAELYIYLGGGNGTIATSNQIPAGSYGLSVTDGNGFNVVTSSMTLTIRQQWLQVLHQPM